MTEDRGARRPVGVFDSGVGGLTVLRAIHELLPHESTIYVGDLACFPYGPKPPKIVRARALALTHHLLEADVKALVIACNTATAVALPDVVSVSPVPVVGVVEPGAVAALAGSHSLVVGVVATEGTVRSGAYRSALEQLNPAVTVHQVASGRLVDLVEGGGSASAEVTETVHAVVDELMAAGCDTILLGCTHFPLVRAQFEQAARGAAVIDSAETTAKATGSLLERMSMLSAAVTPTHVFQTTAHAEAFVQQARLLFGEHVDAQVVTVGEPLPV